MRLIDSFTPIEKANEHNLSVTADTDILSATIAPGGGRDCVIFRIQVCCDTAGVFSARITKSAVTVTAQFNSGANLTADSLYLFDMLVHAGDTVQFRHSATGIMLVLRVQEVGAATH